MVDEESSLKEYFSFMYQIVGVTTRHSIFNFLTCFVLTDLCVSGVY